MDDKLNIVTTFLHNIIVYNIPLLYGTVGEITIEKSGSLNLGVEGTMAVGAIFGYILGCYANSMVVGVLVAFLTAALCGLIFAVLTVTFQANQNITGLTITTFGLGVFFFVGNGVKAVSWPAMNNYANIQNGFADLAIPGLSNIPVLGEVLFDHNVLVYLGIVIALVMWWYLKYTRTGLRLRAVGGRACLFYLDSGPGLAGDIRPGFGFGAARAFARQAGGSFAVRTGGPGFVCALSLPLRSDLPPLPAPRAAELWEDRFSPLYIHLAPRCILPE